MIINLRYKMESGNVFDVVITMDDGDNNTYNFRAIRLHPFIFGNDDDIDSILYPGSVKMEFGIFGSGIQTKSGYYVIINKLSFIDADVVIYKNGVALFYGIVDKQAVDAEYDSRKIIIDVLSNFVKLKDIDPHDLDPDDIADDAPTPTGIACAFFSNVILKTIQLVWPITQVVVISDLKATTGWTFLGDQYDAPASNFGDYAYRMWGPDPANQFKSCIDLVKSILSSFGCVGIIKDNKFIMQSRTYFPSSDVTITNIIRRGAPRPFMARRMEGLQVLVQPYSTFVEYEARYGNIETETRTRYVNGQEEEYQAITNEEEVETIYLHVCGGDPPGVDGDIYPLLVRNMFVYIPGFVAGLGNEQWALSRRNEFYSSSHPTKAALWKVVADSIWTDTSVDRLVYDVEVLHLNNDYNKFYKFPEHPQRFRPRKMWFDEKRVVTRMELIRVTEDSMEFEPDQTLERLLDSGESSS